MNSPYSTFIAILLAAALAFSVVPGSMAAGFADTEGHWATDYILSATDSGLFNGVSEDRFAPDDIMTRGMFVTVLGRFEGIDTEYWSRDDAPNFFKQDVDNDAYYAPHIRWGVCNGIVNGINDFLFAPDRPITREQMAKLLSYYLDSMGHSLSTDNSVTIPLFSDSDMIAPWAESSVLRLCAAGILNGFPEDDGSFSFRPQDTATRAQCAAVFCRVRDVLVRSSESHTPAISITLSENEVILEEGSSFRLEVNTDPEPVDVLWRSSDSDIVSVDQEGLLTFIAPGYAQVYVYTRNGLYDFCEVICKDPEENNNEEPPANLPNANFTKEEKCLFMFGEAVEDPRLYYNGDRVATEADMVTVDIQAWYLKSNGEKEPRTWTLTVHKNLAETVKVIFEEIFNGPEQFPIHELYCYSWSGRSEHSIGSAIDINWSENYYCDPYGNAIVGNYWKPGENPYSISPDGDVAKAFAKYGYVWGINWNSGYKDYMHFSFFGT